MKRKLFVLAICSLMILMGVICGQAEGKVKASIDWPFDRGLTFYFSETLSQNVNIDSNLFTSFNVYPQGDYKLQLEQIDGDPSILSYFEVKYLNPNYNLIADKLDTIKEPINGTLRLFGETEDHYVDQKIKVEFIPFSETDFQLSQSYLHVDLNKEIDLYREVSKLVKNVDGGIIGIYNGKNYEMGYPTVTATQKEILPILYQAIKGNASVTFYLDLYAGDYPYFIKSDSPALPGKEIQVSAEALMSEAKNAEVEFSVDDNPDVTITQEGIVSIAEYAKGEFTVKAKPKGTDIEPSELKIQILGYTGTKEQDFFTDETEECFDNNAVIYIPKGNWRIQNSIGFPLTLKSGDKVSKITITPVEYAGGIEKLVSLYKNSKDTIYIDSSLLYGTQPGKFSYLITAEGTKHYAQKLYTFETQNIPDGPDPDTEDVVFIKPKAETELQQFVRYKPEGCVVIPMINTDGKGAFSSYYPLDGKKPTMNVELRTLSEDVSYFVANEEGSYPLLYLFGYGNLSFWRTITVISSETLEEKDYAISINDAEIAAGQKVTLEPVFANPDVKSREVYESIYADAANVSDIATLQNHTVTAKQSINGLQTVKVTYTSKYCPSQTATATVIIHPKASAIDVSVEKDQIFLYPGMETTQIHAAAQPEDALQRFVYKSSDPKVATVDENGLITAVGSGKTSITVSVDDGSQKKATFNVNVTVPVTEIELILDDPIVQAGKSKKISVTITPEKPTNKKIIWTVADSELAQYVTVSNEGNVNVKANCPSGTITIIATAEGSLPGEEVKAEIELEVVGK